MATAKLALGDRMYARGWRRGALLSKRDAVDLALGQNVLGLS
jgi:hypothetical protein